MSPGPDTVLVLRYTITSGRGVGSAAVAGVQLGLAGHTLLAIVGLSVVIASSPELFTLIAIAGAIYIAWLGVQGIRMGFVQIDEEHGAEVGHAKAMRDAMFTNLLNPKVILLFLALMPNFVDVDRGHVIGQLVTLGITLIIVNTIWQLPLAFAAGWIRNLLDRSRTQLIVNWTTGAILIGIAIHLLVDHVI
jgi:homoserine/homoserine lactone efflux protein